MAAKLAPLATLKVSRFQIPAHGLLPNTSIHNRPLLIYHSVFPRGTSATVIEKHLKSVGIVVPQWRYSMHPYTTQYLSRLSMSASFESVVIRQLFMSLDTTHELLCVSNGSARLCFGGEDNPSRIEPLIEQGDVILVPAGVAHRLLEDLDGEFEMVGSYPTGKAWDMCYGRKGEKDTTEQIKGLSWFIQDPVYGKDGPAVVDDEECLEENCTRTGEL